MSRMSVAAFVTASLAVCFDCAAAPPQQSYFSMTGATVTDIGTLGGDESIGNDINNSGIIVGSSTDANAAWRAFQHHGSLTDISAGALTSSSRATSINSSGAVVGTFQSTSGKTRAFHWKAGNPFAELDAPTNEAGWQTFANAINDSGVIVGAAFDLDTTFVSDCSGLFPVRWSTLNASASTLYCPSVFGYANDVTSSGSIVGGEVSGYPYMFRFIAGQVLGGPQPYALRGLTFMSVGGAEAANTQNHVVGHHRYMQQTGPSTYVTRNRAFYWNGAATKATLLGVLTGGRESQAWDINLQNMVVGQSETNPHGIAFNRAYLWHKDFDMKALPMLPSSTHCVASALNDRNNTANLVQATGHCEVAGKKRAVRWDVTVVHIVIP